MMQPSGSFSGLPCTRSDTQHSIFLMCHYLDIPKTPPIILQHTSCCNLARGRRDISSEVQPEPGERIWGITRGIPLYRCGSPTLRAIMVCPKSVSIIFCAWPLAPIPCNSLICAIFYLQRGRQTVNLNTKRWSMRSKRKSDRISIRKWPSGYWIRTGFRTRSQKPSLKDKTA